MTKSGDIVTRMKLSLEIPVQLTDYYTDTKEETKKYIKFID